MSSEPIERVPASDVIVTPICATCGTQLDWSGRGRKPKYCEEHKPSRTATAIRSRKSADPKATGVIAKVLIIVTVISASRKLSKLHIEDERLEDALSLTDDEAESIAKPLARWGNNSRVGKKVMSPLVENEDLIDAGVALWEYNRRVSKVMSQLRMSNPATNVRSADVPAKPVEQVREGASTGHSGLTLRRRPTIAEQVI